MELEEREKAERRRKGKAGGSAQKVNITIIFYFLIYCILFIRLLIIALIS